LNGSDYNPKLIDWCARNLPFARFSFNEAEPPLPFEDGAFDFIYARSVLTHLTEDLAVRWMSELRRVLGESGILYFTMHGEPLAEGLPPDERAQFDDSQMVVTYASVAGENLCSTYANRNYVEANLLDGFRLVAFAEGRETEHLKQDIYVVEKL
jgi:SAM-dependent methyltransferase